MNAQNGDSQFCQYIKIIWKIEKSILFPRNHFKRFSLIGLAWGLDISIKKKKKKKPTGNSKT